MSGVRTVRKNDLVGQRFGRLVVTHDAGRNAKQNIMWGCTCDCGGSATAPAYDLRAGKVRSCGCLSREGTHRTHGMRRTPLYNVWATMVQRCTNPNDRNWNRYGGRGITLQSDWAKFDAFYRDMGAGYAPGLTLDREDNDGGYNASNCRWVPHAVQAKNTSANVWFTVHGARLVQVDAASVLGVHYVTLSAWRAAGLSDVEIEARADALRRRKSGEKVRVKNIRSAREKTKRGGNC